MLDSVKIDGFKGIRTGIVDNLTNVNIITGKNNRGKSAFLESLYLLNSKRENDLISFYDQKEMFWHYDQTGIIRYQLHFEHKEYDLIYSKNLHRIRVNIKDQQSNLTNDHVTFLNTKDKKLHYYDSKGNNLSDDLETETFSLKERFFKLPIIDYLDSSILMNRKNFLVFTEQFDKNLDYLQNRLNKDEDFLKDLSRFYEIDITKLRHSPFESRGWIVTLNDGKETRPIILETLGDGTKTAISIFIRLFVDKPRLILIDEIESHQHIKALSEISQYILSYIKEQNAQLFVSTHSLEVIKKLLLLAKNKNLGAAVHHFMLEEGTLEARTIPGLDASAIIDLRGEIRNTDEYA